MRNWSTLSEGRRTRGGRRTEEGGKTECEEQPAEAVMVDPSPLCFSHTHAYEYPLVHKHFQCHLWTVALGRAGKGTVWKWRLVIAAIDFHTSLPLEEFSTCLPSLCPPSPLLLVFLWQTGSLWGSTHWGAVQWRSVAANGCCCLVIS